MTRSEYWWYKSYLLVLRVEYDKRVLADGLERLWDRQDLPMKERNERLRAILGGLQK